MKSFAIGLAAGVLLTSLFIQRIHDDSREDRADIAHAFAQSCTCVGDLNNDRAVGVPDLLMVINHWGPCPIVAEICDDGFDNDCDGFIDCDDFDCVGNPNCAPAEICDNGKDDDGDGFVDCDDFDCNGQPNCAGQEICDNGFDDDFDGFIDCDDADCFGFPSCP